MWRRLVPALAILALATTARAARVRAAGEDLLQIVTPASRAVASAHPHVNIVVSFGTASDGTPADPATFRARLNGIDLTKDFEPVTTNGVQTGATAALPQSLLHITSSPRNRLRLSIRSAKVPGAKGRRPHDVDRLRFGAADAPDQAPNVELSASSDIAAIGVPIGFDASASSDPDHDTLSFAWTFSDGGTATGATITHVFASAGAGGVGASVAVSDGVTSVEQSITLPVALQPDPGRTPGVLRIEAIGGLEFSAVAIGARATRSLTVHNVDTAPTSQVKVQVFATNPLFTVAPAGSLDLGPDGSATVNVEFAPTAPGHASSTVMVVASASNRGVVTLLAHGYGGTAPGDGPTTLAAPVFAIAGIGLVRIGPDGAHASVGATTGTCGPPASSGTGDVCVATSDCATPGEVCTDTGVAIDVTDLCSDGQSLFVLSESSFTDPRENTDVDELAGSVVRFDLDAAGTVTGRQVLYRTTDETSVMACDAVGAGAGGLVYLAEFHDVVGSATCDRDERDALVTVSKATGNARTASGFTRIDAVAGVGDCDFRDPVDRLEVSPDGVAKYATFDSHGLWKIAPTPLWFTPDVHDLFQVHPDGSVVFALARDRGAEGTVELYRLSESQVEFGALPVSTLTPCATFTVPNNTIPGNPAVTRATSIVLGPSSTASGETTALVTFRSQAQFGAPDVLPPFGDLRGSVAFSLPSGTTACSTTGLVSLQAFELAR